MLVPINWRLAVPEQLYILRDADVKVLVVEQAFAPVLEPLQAALPDVRIRSASISSRRAATRCPTCCTPQAARDAASASMKPAPL